jgi:hypothetical protein
MVTLNRQFNQEDNDIFDVNKIEADIDAIMTAINNGLDPENVKTMVDLDNITIDQAIVTAFSNLGPLVTILSWYAKVLKAIKGTNNWYDDAADTIKNLDSRISSNDADITNLQNGKADQTSLDDLAGVGRTTETVKGTNDDLQGHKNRTDNPHNVTPSQLNVYTKTEMQTSGQAQVHWDNLTNIPPMADASWKPPVATANDLPTTGNNDGDLRIVLDKDTVYTWDAGTSSWKVIGASGSGISDHGTLKGLADDDHTQYLRTDGARALTGNQDFAQNQALNMVEHKGTAFPTTPVVGQRFFRTDLDHAFIYTSAGEWVKVSGYGSLIRREKFTASITGDEQFTLIGGQYELGKNALLVFVNGNIVDHTEDDATHFTVTVNAGDTVIAWYLQNSPVVTIQADGTLQANLNADMLDGKHASEFADKATVDAHLADDAAHGYHGKSIEYDWNTDNLVIQERHFDAIGGSGGIGNLIKQIDYTWNTDGTVQSEAYTLKDYDTGGTLIRTRQFTISYTWNTDKLPTLIDISDITEV